MRKIAYTGSTYIDKRDNRKYINITYDNGEHKTSSYARYLIEVKLERELDTDEEVDHIDDDCTNDDINNLQILSHSENMKKMNAQFFGIKYFKFICPICNSQAFRNFSNVLSNWNHGKTGPFCSSDCAYDYRSIKLEQTKEEMLKISNKFNFILTRHSYLTDGEVTYERPNP